MSADLIIHGHIVLPDRVLEDGWVTVRDGRIAAIGAGDAPAARESRDARGSYVLPGIVDGQTHSGSKDGYAGIEIITRSAAAGGVTTIVDMPYDNPDPLASLAVLKKKAAVADKTAHIDVAFYGTCRKGEGAARVGEQIEAGVAAFKFSSFETHPERFPRIPNDQLLEILDELARSGIPAGLHNEDQEIVAAATKRFKNAGQTGAEVYEPSRPAAAEMLATANFMELGAATGAHVHIVHFSLAEGYELVEAYRDMGTRATAEICFHYLKFTNEDMVREGARLKVGPPIRPAPENEMLWEQVLDGKVAFVTSDHVGWTAERKSGPDIFACGAGVPGVETLMPGFLTMAVDERGMELTEAVRLLSLAPARFFGLYPRKGAIEIGADGDFAIVERTNWTFDEAGLHDEGKWSPFHGMALGWKPAATYLRGELIFDGKDVIGKPGAGGYLPRVTPAEPDSVFL